MLRCSSTGSTTSTRPSPISTGGDSQVGERFEFPYGEAAEVPSPDPQRVAIYERSRPDRGDSLRGRRDF